MEDNMSDSDQIYQRPRQIATSSMPEEILDFLNGDDLDQKLSEAVRISTVSEDGWPHAAMLSAGEMVALDASEVAMLLYKDSNTSRNLARDGRLTLTLPLHHGLCEMRLRATAKKQEGRHRCFTALVEDVRQHRSHYAEVVSGVTFRLHDPATVLARWSRQIEMLRGLK
jgi:Pyridoxamine 5'-phosphate oxidase